MPASLLYDLSLDLLADCAEILETFADESIEPPARQMVTGPLPAQDLAHRGFDCEGHLAVWSEQAGSSVSPNQVDSPEAARLGTKAAGTVIVRWGIEVARCVPSGAMLDGVRLPTPAGISSSMEGPALDAWVLFHGLRRYIRDGLLFGENARCCTVQGVEPVVAFGPLGGIQGVTTGVVAQVDDHLAGLPS